MDGERVTRPISHRAAPALAAALYLLVAIGFTWPLARGLARDIPWDLGDPLLNCWILGWDADHLLRFLHGDLGALRGIWNANIFYPEPLTLAYSEHLFAQALQILPVFAATRNLILCYNLLFLSTFVLSGLGMFLLVRELTGSVRGAFVAGLIYGFAPLRVPQFSHVQVLSSQWMPFVLFGLRRYFETRRTWPLAGAAVALVAQNLSCGYFLLYFAPFVLTYALVEIADRRLWRDLSTWASLAAAALAVFLATLPFLLPYLELRQLGFGPRPVWEVDSFSADVYSYLTAANELRVVGRFIRVFPKPEGDLFPSLTAIGLAGVCLITWLRTQWLVSRSAPDSATPARRRLAQVALAIFVLYAAFSGIILTGHGFSSIGPVSVRVRDLWRNLEIAAAALALLLAISHRAQVFFRGSPRSLAGFCLAAVAAAFVLSLGPMAKAMGNSIGSTAPYAFFYWYVPGFDGLRVPARFGMLVMLFLAAAAGLGAAIVERRWRHGGALIVAAGLCLLLEANAAPIPMNSGGEDPRYVTSSPRILTGPDVPAVYRYVRTLPPDAILAEFPLGVWAYEIRYVYYSTEHWRRLINGYSGQFPLSYGLRAQVLGDVQTYPEFAWQALVKSGVTHAIVHEGVYREGGGAATSGWLLSHGAQLVARFGDDRVFAVQPDQVARSR
jgi:hypothetical protein